MGETQDTTADPQDAQANGTDGANGADAEGFCGTDERVSEHTCNSQHPAVALDGLGNHSVAWHDNRDGNFEIYFKSIGTRLSQAEIEQKEGAGDRAGDQAGRSVNLECTGAITYDEVVGTVTADGLFLPGAVLVGASVGLQDGRIIPAEMAPGATDQTTLGLGVFVPGAGLLDGVYVPPDAANESFTLAQFCSGVSAVSGFSSAVQLGGIRTATSFGIWGPSGQYRLNDPEGQFNVLTPLSRLSGPVIIEIVDDGRTGAVSISGQRFEVLDVISDITVELNNPVSFYIPGISNPTYRMHVPPAAAQDPQAAADAVSPNQFRLEADWMTSPAGTVAAIETVLFDADADFVTLGAQPGSTVVLLNGANAGKTAVVESVSPNRLTLVPDASLTNDASFVYLLVIGGGDAANPLQEAGRSTCEVRTTCQREPSLFADVVADSWCRSHIVFHDKRTGTDQLHYVQVGYGNFQEKCEPGSDAVLPVHLGAGGFAPSPGGEFAFVDVAGTAEDFARTGVVGQRISYGEQDDPPDGETQLEGLHLLYKGDPNHGGWLGLSKHYERSLWDEQIELVATDVSPTVEIENDDGVAEAGDFGSEHTFKHLAFQMQTPPDLGMEVEFVRLPFRPKCFPGGSAESRLDVIQDDIVVEAPRRPLPPTFVDPIDISSLINAPLAQVDASSPTRYTLENDPSGTVYTNVIVEDARGDLGRLGFTKQQQGDEFKFVLSFRKCDDGPCAVKPTAGLDTALEDVDEYSITLEFWEGPDYRPDDAILESATHETTKVFSKKFIFSPGDDMTMFSFAPGEVLLKRGSIYFVVPVLSGNMGVILRAQTSGAALGDVWYKNDGGVVTNYISPFTVPPNVGLAAPFYAEGQLAEAPRTDTESAETQADEPEFDAYSQPGAQAAFCQGEGRVSATEKLTSSVGNNQHPALAITPSQNVWAVFHSDRDGDNDVYAARFFGRCSTWNSSGKGGDDVRVSRFSGTGLSARFPRVATDGAGNAHVVFQVDDAAGRSQVWYAKGTWSGEFSEPVKVTESPGRAMMPDVVVSYDDALVPLVTIAWHDDRLGNWEVMSATGRGGNWTSSGFGGEDVRITSSGDGDSMFPRLAADKDDNLRLVFHSNRSGKYDVYMASFVRMADKWSSSASGASDLLISKGPANSLFPDIATDGTGSVSIVWHDDRHAAENPDMHEEVYLSYCPRLGHPGKHFPPLVTNVEHKLNFDFQVVSCENGLPVELTNTEDVCLRIDAPNATFWRAANEDGEQGEWLDFKPTEDLNTTVVPWKLTCGNGAKEVCVQVQDQELVSFPLCRQVSLVRPPDKYEVEMFSDPDMTVPLPSCGPYQAAREGDVYVKLVAPRKIPEAPLFDVVHKGLAGIFNQQVQPVEQAAASGFSSAAGELEVGSEVFRGRFRVSKDDTLYHRDGLARLIVRPRDRCSSRPASLETPSHAGDDLVVPEAPSLDPVWDEVTVAEGTWSAQGGSMPVASADMGLDLGPSPNPVPYAFTFGAIAQPFTLASPFGGGSATFSVRLAARTLPDWLSAFSTRVITVSLVTGFPSSIATVGFVDVVASSLPDESLDVISGVLEELPSAGQIQAVDVEFTGLPAIGGGTALALLLEDQEYSSHVAEYGANAKLFMVTVGTTIPSGESAYYLRDF
jgi:hypothetical protein